ncbi:hypothetical protein GCM10025868_08960 [Angustibacter aerolatus]|uniref:Major facilitator superfamily (MFS) profile domain-containing protein n=1 Tax=Angustibacter aerolatus TaxID=1162965 RepID=A0ABQ6JBU2_9ACTN|nr:hypothetical protein GCM10025868_08960 [Angustibacter aerolatus]
MPPVPRAPGTALLVLRDRPFVAVVALNAVFAMHFGLIDVGVPLWLSARTSAPTWMVSVLLLVNTVTVVLLQVRVARGTDTVPQAARAFGRAGLLMAAACAVYSLAAGVPTWVAVVVLLAGALLQVAGEMIGSAGQWGISMGLAPAERQGQYQGFGSTGFAASNMLSPVVLTLLCVEWGRPGWWVLGALLGGVALLMTPVSAWALRTRDRYGAATASG